tara:strand:+ start:76 stop:483 length:408 start_codon:yes stop_codon:yes gene_type:complete
MSFAEQMKYISITSKQQQEAKNLAYHENLKKRQEQVKDNLFNILSDKYLITIHNGIKYAAQNGKREKYINFIRDDFKANCPGLGGTVAFQALWLSEITNPNSKYLLEDSNGDKIHISGIKYNIWNNGSFTTVFSW